MTDFLATVVASAAAILLERLFAYLARTVFVGVFDRQTRTI
ncbi:MAG: hypothetical protein ACRDSP_03820 [Pseudonocardiaceae bacterium]